MKRLLVLVLVMFAVAAFAETDPLLGLPFEGCTEEQILATFDDVGLPLVLNKEGEHRGELCLGNESRELAVYVYDGRLALIESFWSFDSPSEDQRREIIENRDDLVGLFTSYFDSKPLVLAEELEGWLIHRWEILGITLQIKSKAGSEYAALSVNIEVSALYFLS